MIVCGVTDRNDVFQLWFLNLVIGLLIQGVLICWAGWNLWAGWIWAGWNLGSGKRPIGREGKSIPIPLSPPPDAPESSRILGLFFAIASSVSLGLLGIVFYTVFVFSQIPREWGGGVKPVVELFLTEKLAVFNDRKDIPSTTDGKRIGPVICILDTDRMLIVASLNHPYFSHKHRETIAVDRRVVTAVVYEGRYSPAAASPNPTSSPPVTH